MPRYFFLCCALAWPIAGCGSTANDAERLAAEDDKAVLDACGLPAPCPEVVDTVHPGESSCAWSQFAQSAPVHLSRAFLVDGGDCGGRTEIYASSSGRAIVWQFMDGADCDPTYTLQRCTLSSPEFFATCVAEAPAPTSGSPCYHGWFESCVPIDEPECP